MVKMTKNNKNLLVFLLIAGSIGGYFLLSKTRNLTAEIKSTNFSRVLG